MKIRISLSSTPLDILKKYFEERAIKQAYSQNDKSRETVIVIKCTDFLKLARPGVDKEKEQTVKELLEKGVKFNSLPSLGVETTKTGDVEVRNNGSDHEGRHRIHALMQLGVTEIPVILLSGENVDGYAYRWGDTEKRPNFLYGYNGYKIPFPNIETYPL